MEDWLGIAAQSFQFPQLNPQPRHGCCKQLRFTVPHLGQPTCISVCRAIKSLVLRTPCRTSSRRIYEPCLTNHDLPPDSLRGLMSPSARFSYLEPGSFRRNAMGRLCKGRSWTPTKARKFPHRLFPPQISHRQLTLGSLTSDRFHPNHEVKHIIFRLDLFHPRRLCRCRICWHRDLRKALLVYPCITTSLTLAVSVCFTSSCRCEERLLPRHFQLQDPHQVVLLRLVATATLLYRAARECQGCICNCQDSERQ